MTPLVVEEGNSAVLEVTVRDALTGSYVADADVRVTVYKEGGTDPVVGTVWPQTLPYVSGSAGKYRVQLESDVEMVEGQTYLAKFVVTFGGVTRTLEQQIFVVKPEGALLPSTDPASPAYQPPALQTLLNQAQSAYHKLMMGGTVVSVTDQNGERVEFSASNASRLAGYIRMLEMRLGIATGAPMKVYFT